MLPSIEGGTWQIFPDGSMETTYALRDAATWHDGVRVTARDFLFGHLVRLDPEVPTTKAHVDRLLTSVTAPDDRTLVLQWSTSYLWAGTIFGSDFPVWNPWEWNWR
jgi:ABC-type transport system substrate-binding protein